MQRSAAGQRESPAAPGRGLAYLAGWMRFVEEPGGLGFAPGGGLMPAGMNRVVGSGPEVGGFGMGMPNGGLGGLGMSAHLLVDVRPERVGEPSPEPVYAIHSALAARLWWWLGSSSSKASSSTAAYPLGPRPTRSSSLPSSASW